MRGLCCCVVILFAACAVAYAGAPANSFSYIVRTDFLGPNRIFYDPLPPSISVNELRNTLSNFFRANVEYSIGASAARARRPIFTLQPNEQPYFNLTFTYSELHDEIHSAMYRYLGESNQYNSTYVGVGSIVVKVEANRDYTFEFLEGQRPLRVKNLPREGCYLTSSELVYEPRISTTQPQGYYNFSTIRNYFTVDVDTFGAYSVVSSNFPSNESTYGRIRIKNVTVCYNRGAIELSMGIPFRTTVRPLVDIYGTWLLSWFGKRFEGEVVVEGAINLRGVLALGQSNLYASTYPKWALQSRIGIETIVNHTSVSFEAESLWSWSSLLPWNAVVKLLTKVFDSVMENVIGTDVKSGLVNSLHAQMQKLVAEKADKYVAELPADYVRMQRVIGGSVLPYQELDTQFAIRADDSHSRESVIQFAMGLYYNRTWQDASNRSLYMAVHIPKYRCEEKAFGSMGVLQTGREIALGVPCMGALTWDGKYRVGGLASTDIRSNVYMGEDLDAFVSGALEASAWRPWWDTRIEVLGERETAETRICYVRLLNLPQNGIVWFNGSEQLETAFRYGSAVGDPRVVAFHPSRPTDFQYDDPTAPWSMSFFADVRVIGSKKSASILRFGANGLVAKNTCRREWIGKPLPLMSGLVMPAMCPQCALDFDFDLGAPQFNGTRWVV